MCRPGEDRKSMYLPFSFAVNRKLSLKTLSLKKKKKKARKAEVRFLNLDLGVGALKFTCRTFPLGSSGRRNGNKYSTLKSQKEMNFGWKGPCRDGRDLSWKFGPKV